MIYLHHSIYCVSIESTTPIYNGGYNGLPPRLYSVFPHDDPLRTQSLKGVMRWWLRALIAGILYDKGVPQRDIIRKLTKISGVLAGSTDISSPYTLLIEKIRDRYIDNRELEALNKNVFIKLAYRKKTANIREITRKINARICIREERTGPYIRAALYSLLAALIFGGIGRLSRKGFGCFDIITRNSDIADKRLVELIVRLGQDPDKLPLFLKYLKNGMRIIIDKHFAEYVINTSSQPRNTPPPLPSFADNWFRIYYARIEPRKRIELVNRFSKLLLSQYRKQHYGGKDPLSRYRWFLGLPKKGLDISHRRASPLFLSVHGNYALITLFISRDYPRGYSDQIIKDYSTIMSLIEKFIIYSDHLGITFRRII